SPIRSIAARRRLTSTPRRRCGCRGESRPDARRRRSLPPASHPPAIRTEGGEEGADGNALADRQPHIVHIFLHVHVVVHESSSVATQNQSSSPRAVRSLLHSN